MKKIIAGALLGCSLLSTQVLAADTNMYVGLDISKSNNTLSADLTNGYVSNDVDDDSSGFKLKVGVISESGWRLQGYYQRETYDKTIFDSSNDLLSEFGIDVIKGFEITPKFSPFIQAGLGYGTMDIKGYDSSTISAVSFKIGAGVIYKIVPAFEIMAGVDFQARKWEEIQYPLYKASVSERTTKVYLGANFLF